jgi:hypothetical protein
MNALFTVRTIHPDGPRVEDGDFDLVPPLPQGQVVCNLFAEFLSSSPPEFRRKLPFLNKIHVELEWASAGGGAAFLALHSEEGPLAMGVLVSGADRESDQRILDAMRESIVAPMLGDSGSILDLARRPAAILMQLPDQPEHFALVQLLTTALASVFFRAVQRIAAAPAAN